MFPRHDYGGSSVKIVKATFGVKASLQQLELTHGSMMEKYIELFFLSDISIYLTENFCLRINYFLMILNQSVFQIFLAITYETVKNQGEEKQKSLISRQSFHFPIFEIFKKFERNYSIILNKYCLTVISTFEVTLRFY